MFILHIVAIQTCKLMASRQTGWICNCSIFCAVAFTQSADCDEDTGA